MYQLWGRDMLLKKIFAFFVFSLMLFSSIFPVMGYSESEAVKLKGGEVVSRSLSDQLKGGLKGVESKVYIDAPKEVVWKLLDDQEKLMKVIPKIKKVKIIEKTDTHQKIQASMKVCSFLPLFKYTVVMDQSDKYRKMKFNKVDGCFKELYGMWELEPMGNGTVLTYRMFVDPGFIVSSSESSSKLKGVLPEIMSRIKAEAERMKSA